MMIRDIATTPMIVTIVAKGEVRAMCRASFISAFRVYYVANTAQACAVACIAEATGLPISAGKKARHRGLLR